MVQIAIKTNGKLKPKATPKSKAIAQYKHRVARVERDRFIV